MQSQQKENKSSKPLRSYNHDLLVNINNKKKHKKSMFEYKIKMCCSSMVLFTMGDIENNTPI